MGHPVKKFLFIFALALSAMAIAAATASASPEAVIKDCNYDGVLDAHYSKADLSAALKSLGADTTEYGDCQSLIQQALTGSVAHKKKNGGSGGVPPATPSGLNKASTAARRKKIAQQVDKAANPADNKAPLAKVSGAEVSRSGQHALASSAAPAVPTALIVALAGMLLLFGADLAGRLGKMPRMALLTKYLPSGRRNSTLG